MANEYQPPPEASAKLLQQLRSSVAQAFAERLEAIPHCKLALDALTEDGIEDETAERCDLTLMACVDEKGGAQLTLYLDPQLGRQARYLDLQPAEVRKLIRMLTHLLIQIEEITTC